MAASGHNTGLVRKDLEPYLKKVEKLLEDRRGIQDDIRDIKQEVKGKGYDLKMFNEILKLRAMDTEKRKEQEDLRGMYMSALGLC